MTTLIIPDDLGKRLEALAKKAHVQKDELAAELLEEILEDQEDYLIALARSERIEKGIDQPIPFEEIVKKHVKKYGKQGLEH